MVFCLSNASPNQEVETKQKDRLHSRGRSRVPRGAARRAQRLSPCPRKAGRPKGMDVALSKGLGCGAAGGQDREVAPNAAKQIPVRLALQSPPAVPASWDEVEENPQNPQVRAEGMDGAIHLPEHGTQKEGHF